MTRYMFQVSYTSESWAMQVAKQPNVVDRITPVIQACGGTLRECFYAFGEYDVVAMADFPTPQAAAAFSLAVTSGGAVKSIRTTELLTVDAGIEAMRMASAAAGTYRPPVPAGSMPRQHSTAG